MIWFQNTPPPIGCPRLEIIDKEVKRRRDEKKGSKGPDSCRASDEGDRPTSVPPEKKTPRRRMALISFFGPRTHRTEIREVGFPDQSVFLISVECVGNRIHYSREFFCHPLRRTKGSSSSNQPP